jgi:hypothetical protein
VKWLEAVYHDLLNRPLDSAGLATWGGLLAKGVPRYDVVLDIEGSGEYLHDLVASVFNSCLGRAAAPADLSFWTAQLRSGLSDEQLEAAVLGSPEFFDRSGGSKSSFLNGLYEVLLGRPADPSAQAAFSGFTDQQVASTVLSSQEYRRDLVNGWFLRFLRHAPGESAASFFVNALGAGDTDEQAIAALLASDEYFHQFGPAALTSVTITSDGSIKLTLAHPGTITLQVFKVLNPETAIGLIPVVQHGLVVDAAALTRKLPKLKRLGGVSVGHQRKGPHALRWNRRVRGKRLTKGAYELVLQVRRGGKLVDVSDVIPFTVH